MSSHTIRVTKQPDGKYNAEEVTSEGQKEGQNIKIDKSILPDVEQPPEGTDNPTDEGAAEGGRKRRRGRRSRKKRKTHKKSKTHKKRKSHKKHKTHKKRKSHKKRRR